MFGEEEEEEEEEEKDDAEPATKRPKAAEQDKVDAEVKEAGDTEVEVTASEVEATVVAVAATEAAEATAGLLGEERPPW